MVKSARPGNPAVTRGDVWLAALDPAVGSEIRKTRPCVIVSPPEIHDHLRTVMVAPMTTGNRPAPFRITVSFEGKDGLVLLDQLRTLTNNVWCGAWARWSAKRFVPPWRVCATYSRNS